MSIVFRSLVGMIQSAHTINEVQVHGSTKNEPVDFYLNPLLNGQPEQICREML